MVDPVSLAVMSLATTAIGGGVSAFSAFSQGQFQKDMYDYQKRVADINAKIAEDQANVEQTAGEVRAQKAGLEGARIRGETTVAETAGGFLDPGSGSGKAVLASETEITQHDQSMARYDAAQRSYALRVQGAQDTMQANLYGAAGEGAEKAADINTFASVLGTAGSVSNKWIQYGPKGLGILS